MTRNLFVSCLALISLATAAQAPLLSASRPAETPNGWQVTLTNRYSVPVTAFVLDARTGAAAEHPGFLLARRIDDGVPGPAQSAIHLGPQQSLNIRLGNDGNWGGAVASAPAVIYADGATAGDPVLITHILLVRQAEATDITRVLPLLEKAGIDPELEQDLPALITEFENRAATHAAAMRDGVLHHNADRVCLSIVATLTHETNRETPQQAIRALRVMLTRWLNQLKASKPALAPPAGP